MLLDPSGTLGRLYDAKTTPHMFVIDKNGALQYMGGIDSIATADVGDIPKAEPYLKEAMLAVVAGQPGRPSGDPALRLLRQVLSRRRRRLLDGDRNAGKFSAPTPSVPSRARTRRPR